MRCWVKEQETCQYPFVYTPCNIDSIATMFTQALILPYTMLVWLWLQTNHKLLRVEKRAHRQNFRYR